MIRFNNEDIKYLAVELPYAVRYCKSVGDFQGEIHAIDKLLACDIPYALRMRLTIEREVAKGLKKDYKTSLFHYNRSIELFPYFIHGWFDKGITFERICEVGAMVQA